MEETFEQYRPLLFSIAYRMLGSVMEAEDMVQETYLRYAAVPPAHIHSLKSFLCTIVTRLSLDQLKSAKAQREQYFGPWLPEPLVTGGEGEHPLAALARDETISMAFLVLLEKLNPVERAVFLLREVFDYDYAEIAGIVERSEVTCRQIFSRAKKFLTAERPRFEPSAEAHQQIFGQFLQACLDGDLNGLMTLLAEGVTVWSDGGGKAAAAIHPVIGRQSVGQFVLGLMRRAPKEVRYTITEMNGSAALVVLLDDKIETVMIVEDDGAQVTAVRFVRNPDKLRHLAHMIS